MGTFLNTSDYYDDCAYHRIELSEPDPDKYDWVCVLVPKRNQGLFMEERYYTGMWTLLMIDHIVLFKGKKEEVYKKWADLKKRFGKLPPQNWQYKE